MINKYQRFVHFLKFVTIIILWSVPGMSADVLLADTDLPPKQIYAHYMGCYPLGYGPTAYHLKEQSKLMKHDSKQFIEVVGGKIVNWPLSPQDRNIDPDSSAEVEIRRAMRAGIDGFAVDAWAGRDGAKDVFGRLIRAAERMNVPFYMTICLDASCHQPDKDHPGDYTKPFSDSIQWLLQHYGNSPNLARRNGKPLIFGYHSRNVFRTPEIKDMPETPEKWRFVADAFRRIEKNVGQELYFHFCFDYFSNEPELQKQYEALQYIAKNVDAIGGFLGGKWSASPSAADIVRKEGAEWSQPLLFQYVNKSYMYLTGNGLDRLRRCWEAAIQNNSTLIQFVTWNDYGEDTVLAPGYSTGYTVTEVNRYYSDLWKTGKTIPEKDSLHFIGRRSLTGTEPYPFQRGGMNGDLPQPPGMLEVLTLLTKPALVEVPEYKLRYTAPAGLSFRQVPLQTGPVSATVRRNDSTILTVRSHEIVTDKPFRFDPSMVCFSSEFEKEWALDFPDTPPLYYNENGDLDNDGLPNWFEMYWFGRFPYMETATLAKPDDDLDGDGQNNLQEYRNRTNPLVAETDYSPDEIWNLDHIHERRSSFNPDRDLHGKNVWWYLYKIGPRCNTPHDGHYLPCRTMGANIPYAGKMAHLSPPRDDTYSNVHGWISRKQNDDGTWLLLFRPRVNVVLILGWQSPIDGDITVNAEVVPIKGTDGITFETALNDKTVFEKTYQPNEGGKISLQSISVKKGDFLYFIADEKPGYDFSDLRLKNLEIRRISPSENKNNK